MRLSGLSGRLLEQQQQQQEGKKQEQNQRNDVSTVQREEYDDQNDTKSITTRGLMVHNDGEELNNAFAVFRVTLDNDETHDDDFGKVFELDVITPTSLSDLTKSYISTHDNDNSYNNNNDNGNNNEAHNDYDNNDDGNMCESDGITPTSLSDFNTSYRSTNDNEDSHNNNSNNNNNNKDKTNKQISKHAVSSSTKRKKPLTVVERIKHCLDPNALHYKHQVKYCTDELSMERKDRNQEIIEDPIDHHHHCHNNGIPGAFPIIPEITTNGIDSNPIHDAYSNPINDAYLATDDPGRDLEQEGMAVVHAIPWTESFSSDTSTPSEAKTKRIQTITNRCKSKNVRIWSIIIIPLLLCCMIIAAFCGTGYCQKNKNNNFGNNNVNSNNFNSDELKNESSSLYYTPFLTKDELLMAVDDYLAKTNMNALDEKYGTISDWDVSKVKDFSYVFSGRRNSKNRQFNADISKWNVSSATNMSHMFLQAGNFRGDISNWDVSNVVDMLAFMREATFFNSNLSKWNTSQFRDVTDMFYWVSNFAGNGIQDWDVSQVRNMSGMFSSCDSFNANLTKWDVTRVVDMTDLFSWTRRFRGIGIERWNTSNTENMFEMFCNALSFNSNLSNWDVSKVRDFTFMFYGAPLFQGIGVESWNTSYAESMHCMFYDATSFDANLSHWNISRVKDTAGMFAGTASFRGIGIEDWDTSQIESMAYMFHLTSLSFHTNFSKWNTSRVKYFGYMFNGAASVAQDRSIDYNSSFQGIGLEQWNTELAEDMSFMFYDAASFDANLSNWNISRVKDVSWMFYKTTSFRGIGVDMWNPNRVIRMQRMFSHASQFDANLSQWDVSQVENMEHLFSYATSFIGNGVQHWNVTNVETSAYMFASARSLDVDLSQWNMSHDANKTAMFDNTTLQENVWWINDDDNMLQ